jgi:hypothetical protein
MKTNWDQVIADMVAEKVIAAIGDQLKVPPLFADWLKEQSAHGAAWYYSYPIGFGYNQLRCDLRGSPDLLVIEFKSPAGEKLMELKLHT